MPRVSPWTPEKTNELQRLYKHGYAYSKIADELGPGFSRNSVAGKVKQLNLPTRSGKQRFVSPIVRNKTIYKPVKPEDRKPTTTVPKGGHPLVRLMYAEIIRQRRKVIDVGIEAGVSHLTMSDWRRHSTPSLPNLEACFNVLGLTLFPVPLNDANPKPNSKA